MDGNLTRTHPNTLLRRAPLSFTTKRFADSHRSESLTAPLTAKPRSPPVSRDVDFRSAVAQWLVDVGLTAAESGRRPPSGLRIRSSQSLKVGGSAGVCLAPRRSAWAALWQSCDQQLRCSLPCRVRTEESNRPRRSAYFRATGNPGSCVSAHLACRRMLGGPIERRLFVRPQSCSVFDISAILRPW